MRSRGEHLTGPLFMVATLAIGVGFVWAIDALVAGTRPKETPKVPSYLSSAPKPMLVTVESTRQELSCYDLSLMPVWNVLKQDEEFSERVANSGGNCSDMLEIERVDLNRDGKKEILVRGKYSNLCGATGNCGFWVLEETRTRPRILLSASDYVDISELGQQVLRNRTNGYSDLLLKGHFSAAETGHYTYQFDGKKYLETKCMYEVPAYAKRSDGYFEERGWEMITCKEFEKRLGN